MCGIAGLYQLPQVNIDTMCARLTHRGPDDAGVYQQGPVQLGHQRLAIIDVSSNGHQPMSRGGWTIVFNGEIYNYQALKRQLQQQGAPFTTHSDTEVILQAWRYWGPACLNALRGMFSFALYHEASHTLYLARDHFGIKPLFIYRQNGALAFASELKALQPAMPHCDIDPQALVTHLMFLWLPDEQCIYQQAEKFPAGHYGVITPHQSLVLHPYSQVFEPTQDQSLSADSIQAQLQSSLEDSVAHQMTADVPVSVLLSGGLDSSIIAALAVRHNPDTQAYTIKFRQDDQRFEAMPDDARYARQVAQKLNMSLHEIEISPQIIDLWPRLVRSLDEPIGDAASINTYLICQAAREAGSKVLLSGMGADELLAGYRKHYACLLASRMRRFMPKALRKSLPHLAQYVPVASQKSGFRRLRWLKRFMRFAGLDEEAAFRASYSYYTAPELSQMLNPDYHPYIDNILNQHAQLYQQYQHLDLVNRMCYVDSQWFLRGLNLTYCDRASMAASTEVRVPFVDQEVAPFALSLPGQTKLAGGKTKAILKETARAWLPDTIIDRPKAGFAAPLRSWIRHDLKPLINDYLLSDQGLASRGFCHKRAINDMVQADREGRADNAQRLWQLLTLEIWLRQQEGRT